MANYNRFRITSIGRAALSQLLQGEGKCRFTKVCSTDRKYEESGIAALTELADIKQTVTPTSVIAVDSTTVRVTANFTDSDTGYYINTIGLYISVGASDVLYAVCAADTAIYMPARSDLSGENQAVFECYITVGDTDAVEIAVVPANTASEAEVVAVRGQIADLAAYIGYTAPDIYGVEVDFENNKITRLAGAVGLKAGSDFDNIAPWKRRRCNLTHDGEVLAYCGDEGYTDTGFTTVEITPVDSMTTYPVGTPVNVMVEQQPFYYKIMPLKVDKVDEGRYAIRKARYYISPYPKEGFELHPVFANAERPVYFAAYESCVYNTDNAAYETVPGAVSIDVATHRLASVPGKNVILSDRSFTDSTGGDSESTIRAATNEAENGFKQMLYEQYNFLNEDALSATQLLFLIEYANFDSQTNIGKGVKDEAYNSTGSTSSLGNASGASEETGAVSYRGEENLWGHRWWATEEAINVRIIESGYISAFCMITSTLSARTNVLNQSLNSQMQRAAESRLSRFCNIAETLGGSVKPVGDIFMADVVTQLSSNRYILHGGSAVRDGALSGGENGMFALYYTPISADTPCSVRLFYSDRNSAIRDIAPLAVSDCIYTDITVPTSDFIADNTYSLFPYRAEIALENVTENSFVNVVFSVDDAVSGNFAPTAVSEEGKIIIYAKTVPETDIIIPTIYVENGATDENSGMAGDMTA